jgi:hypothetical protein
MCVQAATPESVPEESFDPHDEGHRRKLLEDLERDEEHRRKHLEDLESSKARRQHEYRPGDEVLIWSSTAWAAGHSFKDGWCTGSVAWVDANGMVTVNYKTTVGGDLRQKKLPVHHGFLRHANDPTPREAIPNCSAATGAGQSSFYPCKCGATVCVDVGDICFAADNACLAPPVISDSAIMTCAQTNGVGPNQLPCRCGSAVCTETMHICYAASSACLSWN